MNTFNSETTGFRKHAVTILIDGYFSAKGVAEFLAVMSDLKHVSQFICDGCFSRLQSVVVSVCNLVLALNCSG